MSELIVVAYPDEHRAIEVMATLRRLQAEYLVDLEDAVYVTKDANGKVGIVRRQCTKEYKIEVVDRAIRRELLGLQPRQRIPGDVVVYQYFGITLDEAGRAARAKRRFEAIPWARPVYVRCRGADGQLMFAPRTCYRIHPARLFPSTREVGILFSNARLPEANRSPLESAS